MIDGTFINCLQYGSYIIVIALTGERKYLPIGFGYCPTENSEDISILLNIIKNISSNKIDLELYEQ